MTTLDTLYKTKYYSTRESAQVDADTLADGDPEWNYQIGKSYLGWYVLIYDGTWDFISYWEEPNN